jgi:hypothetical protein
MAVVVKHSTLADGTFSATGATAWDANHTLSGVGTMAEQNANNVNITGGSITGVTGVGSVTSVSATGGTGISVTGSPITSSGTLNITNTAPDQTVVLTAGTGISTSGIYPSFTITNSAPDQTVAITSGTGISVTGTYPNFTVTNTSPSSGGTVTSVSGTGTVSGIALSGTVTSSGNLTLGGTLDLSSPPAIGATAPNTGIFSLISSTRINPRVTNIASNSTITPPSDTADQYSVTALAVPATIAIPSGTAVAGQKLTLRIKDDGTARALTWTTSAGGYRVIGSTLPTTTVASKVVYIGCIYNATESFWDVVSVAQQV